jgi:hypothetical protein
MNLEQEIRIENPQLPKREDAFEAFDGASYSTFPECSESPKRFQRGDRHGRAILTDEQARSIFQDKPAPFAKEKVRAGALARTYGVSVKTVRDIWVGRTWYRATFDLDTSKPISPERLSSNRLRAYTGENFISPLAS